MEWGCSLSVSVDLTRLLRSGTKEVRRHCSAPEVPGRKSRVQHGLVSFGDESVAAAWREQGQIYAEKRGQCAEKGWKCNGSLESKIKCEMMKYYRRAGGRHLAADDAYKVSTTF